MYMYTAYILISVTSRSKKPKKEELKKDKGKKTKAEKVMEKATELFLKYQQGAEERFLKWEEE